MRKPLVVIVAAVAAAMLATSALPANAATVTESFETGLGGWRPDTDGRAPQWSVTRSTDQAFHGMHSLRVLMDGRRDDGTTWIERRFNVPPRGTVRVTLNFQLWSAGSSEVNHWAVVASAGTRDPEEERDFVLLGETETVGGWRSYGNSWTVIADASGSLWVALGTSVLWETLRHHHVDLVSVDIRPTR